MSGEYRRPIIVGIILAIAVLAGLVAWVYFGPLMGSTTDADAVLIALVAPDEEGVHLPQSIALLELGPSGVEVTHVDPDMSVTLPGTTYSRLRDAYSFGGGDLLASVYADGHLESQPEWIVVSAEAWIALTASQDVSLDLPVSSTVFDGAGLYRFESGSSRYSGVEVLALLKGVEYLDSRGQAEIRAQVSIQMARLLSLTGDQVEVRTSLPPDLLSIWLLRMGSV